MSSISNLRNSLERARGKKIQIETSITSAKKVLKDLKRNLLRHEKARELIREAGLKTQQSLQYHISDITSLALDAVFTNPYKLIAEFVSRRNKSECDLFFMRDDNKVDPMEASGGGVVDVGAFALRTASWSMQNPKSDNVLILDEPFSHLRGAEENRKVLQMIQELSQKLGLQIIMIGDVKVPEEVMEVYADKIIKVSLNKRGHSKIT